jgi:hypothetical protein
VSVGGEGFRDAHVFLYAADADHSTLIGQDIASSQGNFDIEFDDAVDGSICVG